MASPLGARRLLLVHAHPDDETINNGATMAKCVADGVHVTLVTCTRGEEGEVLVPELSHLASQHNDQLGTHREIELANAMAALGVTDFRFLGAPQKVWRDSGMMGTEPNNRSDVFWNADLDEAARHLVSVIAEIKPQVMITYDEIGGYGHPDHIQAHRVAMRAAELAQSVWEIEKIYWNITPRSIIEESMGKLKEIGSDFFGAESIDDLPFVKPDELVTSVVNGRDFIEKKMAAMREHPTQVALDGPFFALSNNLGNEVWADEYYTLVKGKKSAPFNEQGYETDIFAGITQE